MERPDLDLVVEYRDSGDLKVLGELYQRYMPFVYGVSLKYLKDREASQDAVMQIFEHLVEALKQYEVRNFRSWLHVTTKNHCLMQLRKQHKSEHLEDYTLPVMESAGEAHHDSEDLEQDLQRLEDCVGKLGDEQRECVRLFYLEKKSYAEITELTGHSTKKVKSLIQNGRRNLKICMGADG